MYREQVLMPDGGQSHLLVIDKNAGGRRFENNHQGGGVFRGGQDGDYYTQAFPATVEYHFATLQDIARLVPSLSALCPQPNAVAPGLADLMINAIEHGNLGITYLEKAVLKQDGLWEKEIERRLALPEFRDCFATVRCERLVDRVIFTITDQGSGFAWAKYLTLDPERALDPNGRGIAMAKLVSFSSLEYRGQGNVAVATVQLSE